MQEINKQRHSLSHILAQAVQRVKDSNVLLWIWPDIENWFYYDFLMSEGVSFSDEDLKEVQKMMEKITKENQEFIEFKIDVESSEEILNNILNQKYKVELKNDLLKQWEWLITYYINTINAQAKDSLLKWINPEYISKYEAITEYFQEMIPSLEWKFVTFVDMCAGPHVENSKDLQPWTFKLDKIAGAYWKWDSDNIMMTRVYWYSFETKDELKDFLEMMEEAKKRDHRILWQKLHLFTFSDKVWLWLPLWLPKWWMLWKQVEDFWKLAHEKHWYEFVRTPHIWNKSLWETSGHWWFYADSMYPPMEVGQSLEESQKGTKAKESETFLLKPMNCPFHVEIYKSEPKSYRDFPLRWCETWTVYRFEKKWQLSWLTRVRWFTQDDAHIMCRKEQVEDELKRVVNFILYIFENFGFDKNSVKVYLSLRDPNNKSKYAWNDEWWDLTQNVLEKVAKEMELNYTKEEWEAAFYGPKLDFKVKDVLWREWQCSTLQFDFNLPERFDMTFVNDKWEIERPYMLHRALFGSFERFLWILIEHYAGAFPLWLSPEQVRIVPVVDKFIPNADKIYDDFRSHLIRATVDDTDNSFNKKIRNAEIDKIPYIIIIWEKEIENWTLSVREYKTKAQYEIWVKEFIDKCNEMIANRTL